MRALLSVSDKTGLADFARGLAARGYELVSTGGTAAALRDAGLTVTDVAAVTGFPEILGGRVKTLHPAIHAAILAKRDDPAHMAALAEHGIVPIDLVCITLYPFEETVASGASRAACIEQIDIGGPAMIRAAAKNHAHVTVVTDPGDYEDVLAAHPVPATRRANLAAAAFALTAGYDAAIDDWMAGEEDGAPEPLRYGENPHQAATFQRTGDRPGVGTAQIVQGKPLSHNNILDADAAWELAAELPVPACAIIKHANPCGVATADTLAAAYRRAREADPTSAFGGIVALTAPLDGPTAEAIAEIFTEVVFAPAADEAARAVLGAKPNIRLLLAGRPDPGAPDQVIRSVAGGFLVQDRDTASLPAWTVATRRAPTEAEAEDLRLAWAVAKHTKSNAIVFAKDGATVGVGAGQMSRVDSTRIAAAKAADLGRRLGLPGSAAQGAAVASDAFFPFPDGVEALAEAGATAVLQPGGSVKDPEVVAAADRLGLAMVLTGQRHFRH